MDKEDIWLYVFVIIGSILAGLAPYMIIRYY